LKKAITGFLLRLLSVKQYLKLTRLVKRNSAYRDHVNMRHVFEIISNKGVVYFVQIGAFDGVSNDPVHEFVRRRGWKGLLVEPVDSHMRNLQKNYEGIGGLAFEQAGISGVNGHMEFYSLPAKYTEPAWLQQIGSFSRYAIEHNLKELPQLIDKIQVLQIPTLTLPALLTKHQVTGFQLLLLDVEGYELEIIKQLNQLTARPEMIVFEWGSMEAEKLKACVDILQHLNYRIFTCGADYLALQY
jgi:FkbM family methyltransferase